MIAKIYLPTFLIVCSSSFTVADIAEQLELRPLLSAKSIALARRCYKALRCNSSSTHFCIGGQLGLPQLDACGTLTVEAT